MLRAFFCKMISNFESKYDYNARYMHEINQISPAAIARLMMLSGITNFQGSDKSIWGGAALAATLHGDCGPCAQLVIDRLIEQGLDSKELAACVQQTWANAGSVGVGYRFAHAVINNDSELETLRTQIRQTYGKDALLAASFATVSYPAYPLLKRALGFSQACQSLAVGEDRNVQPGRTTA